MSRWKTFGLLMVVACLLSGPMEIQAQEPNFAWITDTNGITWREKIEPPVPNPWPSKDWPEETRGYHLILRNDKSIAEVVVPEHARISWIDVRRCINLTNLVLKPSKAEHSYYDEMMIIRAFGSGLLNITAPRTMINSIGYCCLGDTAPMTDFPFVWTLAIQRTELELPKIEIRTHATANGKEMEIV